jgi:hypothetical protein
MVDSLSGNKAIGEDAEDESLDLGDGFIPGGTVGHGAGDDGNFGDPAAVLFAFDFDFHGLSFDLKGRDVNDGGE